MFRWVDATDLNSWANRRVAQEQLPRLIRLLIASTNNSIERISFPAGESVQSGGFDGFLLASEGNSFIPTGLSIWEFGTGRNPRGKANSDFIKRTENSLGVEKSEATFIFVTPRRWGNKADWESEMNEKGQWAEVRAYDADDIEQWLELAPAVNIWLGHLIGKRPEHTQDIESFWEEWRASTDPQFSECLLLFGREAFVERIKYWLDNDGSISVQSDSTEESIAFLISYVQTLPFEDKKGILARCVIAYDQNVFRTLSANNEQLILIPMFTGHIPVGVALEKGHKVFVPLDRSSSSNNETVILPAFTKRTLEKALVSVGLEGKRANELADASKGSLSILRRLTAVIPEILAPLWSRPEEARKLIPFLLVGTWNHSNTNDRTVLSKLAGETYEEVLSIFTRWANEPDAPVKKVGDCYQLTSRVDSWLHLNKYIDVDDLVRLGEVIVDVFGSIDPKYEMPKEERFMAAVHGKILPHSSFLRKGLSESLAMISTHVNMQIKNSVQAIVWNLLREGARWDYWASLNDSLIYLAEACPDAFTSGLEKSITNSSFCMGDIFNQETTMGGCAHSNLLWAIETCAWSPSYLGQASLLLAKLDGIDSGGNYANRPFNSLRDIFLCWHPQTTASISRRFEVIDSLLRHEAKVGWKLLCQLLPSHSSFTTGTKKPEWRDWAKDFKEGVTNLEYFESIENVCQRIIGHIDSSKWIDVIDKLASMPQHYSRELLNKLSQTNPNELDTDTRLKIWTGLRNEVHRHRKYSEADWSLPSDITEILYEQYKRFEPQNLIEKLSWLFDYHPEHPDCFDEDWEKEEQGIQLIRINAIKDLLQGNDSTLLIDMSERIEQPFTLGILSGKEDQVKSELISILTEAISRNNPKTSEFACGLVSSCFHAEGWNGIDAILEEIHDRWDDASLAEFFRYLPFSKHTWEYCSRNVIVKEMYWKGVPTHLRPSEVDYIEAIMNLLEYDRPCAAFYVLYHALYSKRNPSPELTLEILLRVVHTIPDSKDWIALKSSFSYELEKVLGYLEETNLPVETLETLEWIYLPIFRYGRKPKFLIEKIVREPDFFREVIVTIYRGENEAEQVETIDSNKRMKAQLAYDLLNEWEAVPGVSADGNLNGQYLREWITIAREYCSAVGRGAVADVQIGQVLAYSPFGTDDLWPHEEVRNIIETIQSEALEDGFHTGTYNKRGTISKDLDEGGIQERRLAEQYKEYADAFEGKWIRTAAILRRLYEGYLREADREDIRSQLNFYD
ncbi:hypothetical protein SAMN02799630_06115 [Paenibacillus sp. UNCCL117]|uniref:hypothetical protein n=1 Tax=unclassified Paenibacillus TaxID=185978 RepID=UPI000891F030|nr:MULTISPECIES: hypothetical protein [unclassified Paenibacillus]SDE70566.1 hypothetical protein SAMN04488602_1501 [Paenibacillus sp. cl123]SFW71214.1 hypothetical protein SAMN02799630_06115 [Paenibacillus sp. UNCCL117]